MAMTRAQLRRATIIAQCKAAKNKPIERARVRQFMQPITAAFHEIMSGHVSVDDQGIPITRLAHNDQYESLPACINGFVCAMSRLLPELDMRPLQWVSSDLEKGKLMSLKKAQAARKLLSEIEDGLCKKTWNEISSAVDTTRIEIEFERLGVIKN